MKEQIIAKFGDKALEQALFYNHKESLRFKLSEGSDSIKMFLTAYHKAQAIVDFAFQDIETVSICLTFFGSSGFVGNLSIFRSLKECGITIPKNHSAWHESRLETDMKDEEYELNRNFICFDIARTETYKFLWAILAKDLGVYPRSQCELYLFDLKTSILLHPYDDRGMDIIGSNKDRLKQLYDRFNTWLLDYDRLKMDSYFDCRSK